MGITHKITPTGVWIMRHRSYDTFYRFPQILNVIPSKSETSLSGKFMSLIFNGSLHILTFNNKGKEFFDDIIDFPHYFIDAHFIFQEQYLVCLTSNYSFTVVSALNKNVLQSYNFRHFLSEDERCNVDNYTFEINESDRTFTLFVDEGNTKCFALPDEGNSLLLIEGADQSSISESNYDSSQESESEEESSDYDEYEGAEINTLQELKDTIIDRLNQNTDIIIKKNRKLLTRKEAYERQCRQYRKRYAQLKRQSDNIRAKYYGLYQRISALIEADQASIDIQGIKQSFAKTQQEIRRMNIQNCAVDQHLLYSASRIISEICKDISKIQNTLYL